MIISKRLNSIQKYIEDDNVVIDVGCDHALLDIYLTLNRKKIKCIACDINKNALEIAKKNIKKYSLENKIETVLCDGLDLIEIDNHSYIIISGMGTSTIMHILNTDKIYSAKKLIIQTNNDYKLLREYMINKGFYITNEEIICDRNKDYIIMVFEKGKRKYNDMELEYGPIILKNSNLYISYFHKQIGKLNNIYQKLSWKHFKLRLQIKRKIKKIMYLTREKK